MPIPPLIAAGSFQTIADVEVREELLTPDRSKAVDESRVRKLRLDFFNIPGVLFSIRFRPAQAPSGIVSARLAMDSNSFGDEWSMRSFGVVLVVHSPRAKYLGKCGHGSLDILR